LRGSDLSKRVRCLPFSKTERRIRCSNSAEESLLTTVAHELKRRDPSLKIWQVSHSAELLRYNPDYQKIFTWDDWYLRYSFLLNRRRTRLSYATELIPMKAEVPPEEHVLKILCRKAGIKGEVELRPYYTSGVDEKEFGSTKPGQIAVHTRPFL